MKNNNATNIKNNSHKSSEKFRFNQINHLEVFSQTLVGRNF
jgi:hypothetical protein